MQNACFGASWLVTYALASMGVWFDWNQPARHEAFRRCRDESIAAIISISSEIGPGDGTDLLGVNLFDPDLGHQTTCHLLQGQERLLEPLFELLPVIDSDLRCGGFTSQPDSLAVLMRPGSGGISRTDRP